MMGQTGRGEGLREERVQKVQETGRTSAAGVDGGVGWGTERPRAPYGAGRRRGGGQEAGAPAGGEDRGFP